MARPKKAKLKIEAAKPKPSSAGRFNIMAQGADLKEAVKESLTRSRKHEYRSLNGDPNKDRLIIPIPEFPLAAALRSRGFMAGTLLNIYGPEGIGKTTLMFTIMGWFIRHNAPCWYGESENKPMMLDRMGRCLHSDRKIAAQMMHAIHTTSVRELGDWYDQQVAWLKLIRDSSKPETFVPLDIPVFLGTDTFSKMLSASEAQGFLSYSSFEAPKVKSDKKESKADKAKREKAETAVDIGGGRPFQHAMMSHAVGRKLPHLLGHYNAFMMINHHQDDKIDMSGGGGGSFIPADVAETFNTTAIGGRGFKQNAAYQAIIGRKGYEKGLINKTSVNIGNNLVLNVIKNSYGPGGKCNYRLIERAREDTETCQEMALDFNPGLVEALLETGLLPITVINKNSITCRELGLEAAPLRKFAEAFYANTDLVSSIMSRLGFVGCEATTKFPELNAAFAVSSEAISEADSSDAAVPKD